MFPSLSLVVFTISISIRPWTSSCPDDLEPLQCVHERIKELDPTPQFKATASSPCSKTFRLGKCIPVRSAPSLVLFARFSDRSSG
jgi:hypothetical protein